MGRPMKIILNGQNELIDRRAIVFSGEKKKDPKKDKDKADKPKEGAESAADEPKDTVPEDVEPSEDSAGKDEADGPPPVDKKQGGCGCRAAGLGPRYGAAPMLGLLVLGLFGWARRRNG